jgi:hypothetical protein
MRRLLLIALVCACHKSSSADLTSPPQSRNARRVSIEMLRRSFPVVFGNDLAGQPITWTVGGRTGFDAYTRALGEADYADVVDENLDPSPLYLKFLDDAARDACNKVLAADFARADPAQRALLRYVALTDTAGDALNKNLRYLRLRFHGTHVADADDAPIASFRQLFTDSMAANAGSVKEGWRAVCVALVTAPEFSLY